MNEAYEDLVTIFPPEKSPERDAVILRFQTRSGEVLRLGASDTIARNLGTQLLPPIDGTFSIHSRDDGTSITPERVIK